MITFKDFTELKIYVGKDLGETPYLTITQDMINGFAEATHEIGRASCRERVLASV